MIETDKEINEIKRLINSRVVLIKDSPDKTIISDYFGNNNNLYTFDKNGKNYIFQTQTGLFRNLFQSVFELQISDENNKRILKLIPRLTRLTKIFGIIVTLTFVAPVIYSLFSQSDKHGIAVIVVSIYTIIVLLLFWFLAWLMTTWDRQTLEKQIDRIVG